MDIMEYKFSYACYLPQVECMRLDCEEDLPMKKIITALLVVIVFMVSAIAVGEENEFDFSAYTTDELIRVYTSIQEEFLRRDDSAFSDFIGRGTYIAGQTIASGTYRFLCTESGVFSETGYVNNVITIETDSGELIFRSSKISVGGYVTFTLSDGDELYIGGCSGSLVKMETPSWAP